MSRGHGWSGVHAPTVLPWTPPRTTTQQQQTTNAATMQETRQRRRSWTQAQVLHTGPAKRTGMNRGTTCVFGVPTAGVCPRTRFGERTPMPTHAEAHPRAAFVAACQSGRGECPATSARSGNWCVMPLLPGRTTTTPALLCRTGARGHHQAAPAPPRRDTSTALAGTHVAGLWRA